MYPTPLRDRPINRPFFTDPEQSLNTMLTVPLVLR